MRKKIVVPGPHDCDFCDLLSTPSLLDHDSVFTLTNPAVPWVPAVDIVFAKFLAVSSDWTILNREPVEEMWLV